MNSNAPVTIWRNPDCGTSRNTLALIRQVKPWKFGLRTAHSCIDQTDSARQ